MKKIFVRSPYFIEVDEVGQTNAKIEIFLWNKGDTIPTIPNYTLSKEIASPTQTALYWNVSDFAKEFIKPIAPVSVSVPTEEDVQTWCYMQVISYSDNVEVNDETFVCLNGYTQYSVGYNYSTNSEVVLLANENIELQVENFSTTYVNAFLEVGSYDYETSEDTFDITLSEATMYKLPILNINNYIDTQFYINASEVCEPKYTPVICTFINRFGGWQYLTFFKANTQGVDVTSKDYNLLHSSIDYNVLQGQKQRFNFQGKQKIKCNTGWVDENYSELIIDLLLSEVVLLDNKPAIVKSQSADIKTHLKDKNINYEIDFEFNYGLINDVI